MKKTNEVLGISLKLVAIISIILCTYFFYLSSQNGRYHSIGHRIYIDTRNGNILKGGKPI
jgi:hypothetical protein